MSAWKGTVSVLLVGASLLLSTLAYGMAPPPMPGPPPTPPPIIPGDPEGVGACYLLREDGAWVCRSGSAESACIPLGSRSPYVGYEWFQGEECDISAFLADRIKVTLEEPAQNAILSGVGNLRGWAVGRDGIDYVEYHVDGVLKGIIPYGGRRLDVANAFPNFPESENSGYSTAFNYGNLPPGPHTVKIRAVSNSGEYNEVTNSFNAIRFHKPFIPDNNDVNIDSSLCAPASGVYKLKNILVEGSEYDVILEWQKPAQQFHIIEIINKQDNALHGEEVEHCPDKADGGLECPVVSSYTSLDDQIVVTLEEPAHNTIRSGVGNLRGWAVGPDGIDRVEYFIDGISRGTIPYGGCRQDVGYVYSDYPGSAHSVYSAAFNYGLLTPGPHTVEVRAISGKGDYNSTVNNFEAIRFHRPFIADPDEVNIEASSCEPISGVYELKNLVIEGKMYEVTLKWQSPAQQFHIVEIR